MTSKRVEYSKNNSDKAGSLRLSAREQAVDGSAYMPDGIGRNGELFGGVAEVIEGKTVGARERSIARAQQCADTERPSPDKVGVEPVSGNPRATESISTKPTSTDKDKALSELLLTQVWRSSDLLQQMHSTLSTGFAALDQAIAIGGWPLGATTELGLNEAGIGELRLLLPALKSLMASEDLYNSESSNNSSSNPNSKPKVNEQTSSNQHCVLIAPPYQPYAPALQKLGLEASKVIVVRPGSLADTLWAAEQALLSESCAAVLTWAGRHNLSQRETRRLQLAAEKSNALHVLFRHSDLMQQASVSSLRAHLKTDDYSRLRIKIIKQPQGWAGQECALSLPPFYERWQRLPAQLLPHANQAYRPQKHSLSAPKQLRILARAAQSKIFYNTHKINNTHNTQSDSNSQGGYQNNNVISLKRVS